jgi:hypothetical protein
MDLYRRNDKPLVLGGDTHALSGLETGGRDPSSGEFYPRKGGRLLAHMEGRACRFLVAPGFLDGDRPFGDGWRWCFMIGVSHDRLSCEEWVVVSGR